MGTTWFPWQGEAPPPPMPDLVVWSKASEIEGYGDGASLPGWNDISGHGRHWTSEPAIGFPKYLTTAGPGGGPAVRLGASNSDGWFNADPAVLTALPDAAEAFLVTRAGANSANAGFWDFSTAATSPHYHYANTDVIYDHFANSSRLGPMATGDLTLWRLYNPSGESGEQTYRLDGAVLATSANGYTMGRGMLGQSHSFNTRDQYVAEIRIYDGVLTVDQREAVEAELAAEYPVLTIA